MTYRKRRYYSEKDKGLIWERWKSGVSQHDIARLFSTKHSSIERALHEFVLLTMIYRKAQTNFN